MMRRKDETVTRLAREKQEISAANRKVMIEIRRRAVTGRLGGRERIDGHESGKFDRIWLSFGYKM